MSPANVEKGSPPGPAVSNRMGESLRRGVEHNTLNLEVLFPDVSVRRPQYTTHVGEDVRDLTALISLTRPTDVVVEDEIKWQTKALKAQAIAAILLAVVQSQMLSSSSPRGSINLYTATIAFFSVGILLDVVGAFFALTSAYYLDANLFGVKSFIRGLDEKELDEITHLRLSPLAKKLARQNSLRPIERRSLTMEEGSITGDKLFRKTSLEKYSRSIEENKSAGYLASATIALGFLSFPVGFLCQLQGTQSLAVQIAAYIVVGILVFLRFLVIPLQDRLQNLMGRKIIPW